MPPSAPSSSSSPSRARAIALWSGFGVAALLGEAAVRMGVRAVHGLRARPPEGALELLGVLAVVAVFAWGEGHRALARRFAPYVVRRSLAAGAALRGGVSVLGAPLRAMGLYGAPRREVVRAWAGVAGVVVAVLVVRALPPGPRAAVDLGVCVALAWGALAVGVQLLRAVRR